MTGYDLRFEAAAGEGIDLLCDVAVCGVDNNPTRAAASRYFREHQIPVVFAAVSTDGDSGYVFVQNADGPCFGCLFPDAMNDDRYPCPGTPAIADILQAVGALAVYAIDSCLMKRPRAWNYRRSFLANGSWDSTAQFPVRDTCPLPELHIGRE